MMSWFSSLSSFLARLLQFRHELCQFRFGRPVPISSWESLHMHMLINRGYACRGTYWLVGFLFDLCEVDVFMAGSSRLLPPQRVRIAMRTRLEKLHDAPCDLFAPAPPMTKDLQARGSLCLAAGTFSSSMERSRCSEQHISPNLFSPPLPT